MSFSFQGHGDFPRASSGPSMQGQNYVPEPSDEELRQKADIHRAWVFIALGALALAVLLKAPKWWPVIEKIIF